MISIHTLKHYWQWQVNIGFDNNHIIDDTDATDIDGKRQRNDDEKKLGICSLIIDATLII